MPAILVTGASGLLGRNVVTTLTTRGYTVRALSRTERPGMIRGDLLTGEDLRAAVDRVDTIVHCATGPNDPKATGNLIDEAAAAGVRHLVFVSIVGVDRIPLPYYHAKLTSEHVVENGGLPFTILRATQFHNLVAGLFSIQRRLPMLLAPSISIQPVDVTDVAGRLADLVGEGPAGRVPDFGGPQILTATELAALWLAARGSRRRIASFSLPGRTFAALRAGEQLSLDHRLGTRTFEQFIARP